MSNTCYRCLFLPESDSKIVPLVCIIKFLFYGHIHIFQKCLRYEHDIHFMHSHDVLRYGKGYSWSWSHPPLLNTTHNVSGFFRPSIETIFDESNNLWKVFKKFDNTEQWNFISPGTFNTAKRENCSVLRHMRRLVEKISS